MKSNLDINKLIDIINKLIDKAKNGELEVSSIAKEYADKLVKRSEYRKSIDFEFDIQELKLHLENKKGFATDGIWYEPDEHTPIEQKAIKIAETLMQTDQHLWKNITENFPESECVYDNVVFSVMFGQGTLYSFRLKED
jgi:hypothetical protein